ncbi:GyrI-like domain-containing protein [Paenibacillus timonensis]|uniref:GyrI-like domain-containing protein n=1 Tax=Paenibacillus timonensis TaxID=225915 RepID=A0ABW3S815_9BACL|nr:GyrI-like domain-containing protein [Paenibacillus timonensis]MCH1639171.1 GyrI-like domain-containing protein [Paenibacillus timonensis]
MTPHGGGTWAVVQSDGSNEAIQTLCSRALDLGICFGFDSYMYPEGTWLKFEANGSITGQTLGNVWKRINTEFLPQSKYEKSGPTIEKYAAWDEASDTCKVEIWIPVQLKPKTRS